jgi:hypothetical protein
MKLAGSLWVSKEQKDIRAGLLIRILGFRMQIVTGYAPGCILLR